MPDQSQIVIRTSSLGKIFNDVQALRSLDLQVPKNSIFGFLGPNGAGKTTTIKLLLGLIKPTAGGGSVFGLDITKDSVDIRSRVGYLPQEPRFYTYMSARETLQFTARFFYSGPKDALEERVQETLELVGLADKADRPIKGFSGGEFQRLGIAQAQVNYPDLLILDEPAASLDPMGRRDVLAVMERLQKYTTIFYSTHILDDVQRVSDTVAILNNGELVSQGPIETLLAGSEGLSYSVVLRGETGDALGRLKAQGWVSGVDVVTTDDGKISWKVSVTDQQTAEAQMLRLILASPDLQVLDFRRRVYELEDIFMQIIEGEKHGKH